MRETGKVAIARVVMRSKEQLVAIRPMGDVLEMATMLFADEVLPPEQLDETAEAGRGQDHQARARDRQAARRLARRRLRPGEYRDTYREEVLALIERKAQGEEIAVQPAAEEVAAPGARSDERAQGEPRRRPRARARMPAAEHEQTAQAGRQRRPKPAAKLARQTRHEEAGGQEAGRQEVRSAASHSETVVPRRSQAKEAALLDGLPGKTRLRAHRRAGRR